MRKKREYFYLGHAQKKRIFLFGPCTKKENISIWAMHKKREYFYLGHAQKKRIFLFGPCAKKENISIWAMHKKRRNFSFKKNMHKKGLFLSDRTMCKKKDYFS